MQKGTVTEHNGAWFLYYRERVVEPSGKVVSRKRGRRLAAINACSKSDANELAKDFLGPINAANARPESVQTVRDFLHNVYMPDVIATKKPATANGYKEYFRMIEPHLNGLALRDTRTSDVGKILKAVAATRPAAKPFAQTTLAGCRNFLSGAFKFAVNEDLVRENPVRAAKTPKGAKPKADNTYAYTTKEVMAFVKALPEPAATVVLTAAFSGLRHGELRGLRWEDFTGDELAVSRNVYRAHIDETKTQESNAPVPVIPFLKKALKAHRRRFPGTTYIFEGLRDHKPLHLENLTRRTVVPALKKAGLEWHAWHAFRRGLMSNLYRLKTPPAVIQRIARHSNVSTTMKHYVKTVGADSHAAMAKLEKAFKRC